MNNRTFDKGNGFATAAMICGVLGCVFMCLGGTFCLFFGALALTFGLLARGNSIGMTRQSRNGTILGIIAMIMGAGLLIRFWYVVFAQYGGPEAYMNAMMTQADAIVQKFTGMTYQELMESYR